MGHAQHYREYQPELAVQYLLYGVDTVILHLGGGLRQYLRGGNQFFDVNLPGPKYVSQGAAVSSSFKC